MVHLARPRRRRRIGIPVAGTLWEVCAAPIARAVHAKGRAVAAVGVSAVGALLAARPTSWRRAPARVFAQTLPALRFGPRFFDGKRSCGRGLRRLSPQSRGAWTGTALRAALTGADLQLVRRSLGQANMFRELTPDQLERTLVLLQPQKVLDGATLIQQGDIGDGFYILLHGKVQAFVCPDDGGGENMVKLYDSPGAYFGELALLMKNNTRRATIRALGDAEVLRLSRADFENTLGSFRELLLRNAAVRPADVATKRVKAIIDRQPIQQRLGSLSERTVALLAVAAFLLAGTVFYAWSGFEEFPEASLAAGLYYSVTMGLSIGFGELHPLSEYAPFFTFVYVLVGAALLVNVLSTVVADAIEALELQTEEQGGAEAPSTAQDAARAGIAVAIWWMVGGAYGLFHEHWGAGKSLLFAISATSTVGIQGLDSKDDLSLSFCAVYCLIGVPLYASALGKLCLLIAEWLLQNRRAKIRERAASAIRACDEECLSDLFDVFDANQDGLLDQAEMPRMLSWLTMSEEVTQDDIQYLLAEFDKDDGTISLDEFMKGVQRWLCKDNEINATRDSTENAEVVRSA